MPYIPYSKVDKRTRKNKWKELTPRCYTCLNRFTTYDPFKKYCSVSCRRKEADRQARNKRKAENRRKDDLVRDYSS